MTLCRRGPLYVKAWDTTCYDLDQAKEAYAGKFESQTEVNLDLLEAVLNVDLVKE